MDMRQENAGDVPGAARPGRNGSSANSYISNGKLPRRLIQVWRRGELVLELGAGPRPTASAQVPLAEDSIFRIY
ncbi:hypothetical protein ACU4GD_37890 [Cupriavidus basilensis]